MAKIGQFISKILRRHGKKRAVYTCMFGFSEAFKERPYVKDDRVDYVCFTDDRTLSSPLWRFIYVNPKRYGTQKTSKLVKLCPHLFLSHYESSLYVDNTVRINASLDDIFSHLTNETPFVTYKHNLWDCPYIENNAVIEQKYADPNILTAQIETYEREGLPRHAGLYHSAILLRRHNDENVKQFGKTWFNEIEKYSYRDQVALSYLVWKLPFQLSFFDGFSTEDNLVFWPDDVGPRIPRGFIEADYMRLNPGLRLQGMTPREHYLKIGLAMGLICSE